MFSVRCDTRDASLLPVILGKSGSVTLRLLAVGQWNNCCGTSESGKKVICSMEKSIDPRPELTLPMLRDLVNKLAVISGHCDLLGDCLRAGSQSAGRVGTIQEIAREMAKELNEYQCRLLAGWGVSSGAIPPIARKAG